MAKKTAPRIGRPPKDEGDKVQRLAIYLPPDVLDRVEALARRDGARSGAVWAAQAVTRLAREEDV